MPKLFALAGIAGVLALAGCAPVPLTKADVDGRIVCDDLRMAKEGRRSATWADLLADVASGEPNHEALCPSCLVAGG